MVDLNSDEYKVSYENTEPFIKINEHSTIDGSSGLVWATVYAMVKPSLQQGDEVVTDATDTYAHAREECVHLAKEFDVRSAAFVAKTSFSASYARNEQLERPDDSAIDGMVK